MKDGRMSRRPAAQGPFERPEAIGARVRPVPAHVRHLRDRDDPAESSSSVPSPRTLRRSGRPRRILPRRRAQKNERIPRTDVSVLVPPGGASIRRREICDERGEEPE